VQTERYILSSTTHILVLEITDNGYLSYADVCLVSLRDKRIYPYTDSSPFPLGSVPFSAAYTGEEMLPVRQSSVRIHKKKLRLDFISMENGVKIIRVDIPKFDQHWSLRGELVVFEAADADCVAVNLPWRRDKSAFSYGVRSPNLQAEGVVQFGTAEIAFTRGKAYGVFDWSSGMRPKSDLRYWAGACGNKGGSGSLRLGLNVGYNSADSEYGTENAFFVDGRLHKLDQVTFHVPPANWLRDWHFTSNDKRLDMVFTPLQQREVYNGFFLYSMKRMQFYGSFSGKVILDNGYTLEFQDIRGFAERSKSRF
jgi:hypothetical protein